MNNWPNPFIEQRADPFILRHLSHYYFIASVPEYDRLEIRRAVTLEGLRDAEPVVVWRAPQSGPMSQLIWAPELHEIDGKWYIMDDQGRMLNDPVTLTPDQDGALRWPGLTK